MLYQVDYFADHYAEVAATSPPLMSMLEHKVSVGYGTNVTHVSSYHPWESVSWLIDGRTVSGIELYPPTHRLDRLEALRLCTVACAWFRNEETVNDHSKLAN